MAQQSSPVLTIVKGPQTGQTFELNLPRSSLGRTQKSSVFLNDMTVSITVPPLISLILLLAMQLLKTLILSMVPGLMNLPLLTKLPCVMAQLFRLAHLHDYFHTSRISA